MARKQLVNGMEAAKERTFGMTTFSGPKKRDI
jgi:hypothetical protein